MDTNARFTFRDLDAAAAAGLIEPATNERLKGFLAGRQPVTVTVAPRSAPPAST